MTETAAARLVPAPAGAVFALLSDLANQSWLATRFVAVVDLDPSVDGHCGGRVRVPGPLGLRRTALTRVEHVRAPRMMASTRRAGHSA